jgi:hypothetical protein
MSTEEPPDVVEIPVRQFQVNITLEDMLARIEQAGTLIQAAQPPPDQLAAAPETAASPPPDVMERLQRLGELARQLREEIGQLNQQDPTLLGRLKQVQQAQLAQQAQPTQQDQPPSA